MQAAFKPEEPEKERCGQTHIFHYKACLEYSLAAHLVSITCINPLFHTYVDLIRLDGALGNLL